MYVVVVDFELKPGQRDRFMPLMLENARRSVADEPGCRQFDVCAAPGDLGTIFLYELYDDRAAFDAHLASPHFRSFDAETRDMLADKRVRLMQRLSD